MNPRVQHAYRYRGRHKPIENATSRSPVADDDPKDNDLRRSGGPVAVSGKSVSGRVADHRNYQFSSTMGSTTHRERRTTVREGLHDYFNSARTGSLAPGSSGYGGLRAAEPQSPRGRGLDFSNMKKPTKAQTLKHHIR